MKLNYTFLIVVLTSLREVLSVAEGEACTTDAECTTTNQNTYCRAAVSSSCAKGECRCLEQFEWDSGDSKCKLKRYYQDECTSSDSKCQAGTTCTGGMCTCTGSYNSELHLCLSSAKKARTEVCTVDDDCYIADGLTGSVECVIPTGGTEKTCQCVSGYIPEGPMCKKPRHGASCLSGVGCKTRFTNVVTADGSFTEETCLQSRCNCANAYSSKTIRIGGYQTQFCVADYTGTKVSLGGACTETKKCASGFCYRCPGQTSDVCVADTT